MSFARRPAWALLPLMLMGLAPGQPPSEAPHPDAFAFIQALDEAGARGVWPGFKPSDWPLAVFDGERTILLRHPSPPPEFAPMPGRPGVLVMQGQYPAVVGNSTREIGGVRTATVIATPGRSVESTLLATVEEVFHVFWLARHPSFRPNEMARYAYPFKDPENARRLLAEDESLARALEADGDSKAAAWASTALRIRLDRTSRLPDALKEYETSLEMMEGTANYTSRRSLGEGPGQTATRLRSPRPAEGVRWRSYDTGAAICFLLDRLDPGWKARSEEQPTLTIVELLKTSLERPGVKPAVFGAADLERFRTKAARAIADLRSRQQALRRDLAGRPGPRVVIDVAKGAEPFRVQRFDPINLFVLDGGEVVQANFITLAGAAGDVEVKNPDFKRDSYTGTVALTVSAGPHPLSDGIRRATVVGLQDAPQIARDGDSVTITARGLRVELHGGKVRADGETLRVTVPSPGPSR